MVNPEFWQDKKVFVTGHTGFKGSWLTLWLLSLGAEVWGYSLEPEGDPNLFQALAFDQSSFSQLPGSLHHRIGDLHDFSALQQLVLDEGRVTYMMACVHRLPPPLLVHSLTWP